MHLLKNGNRPFHLGAFPLETLPRDDELGAQEIARPAVAMVADRPASPLLGKSTRDYRDLFGQFATGEVAPEVAPDTDDMKRCTVDILGAAYFLDASHAGICLIPESAWRVGATPQPHSHAIVIMVEHSRVPDDEPLSAAWTRAAVVDTAEMRATEIAVNIAGHIRLMGYDARADVPGDWMRRVLPYLRASPSAMLTMASRARISRTSPSPSSRPRISSNATGPWRPGP